MTVVPTGGSTALLICDGCGTEDTGSASPYDSDFVWPLVAALGWTIFDLVAPSRFVRTVLHTMKLDTAFRIFPDHNAALTKAADG
ncbi:hypothetical protein ACQP2X_35435 [Actinoplanes sp. CA-131856]